MPKRKPGETGVPEVATKHPPRSPGFAAKAPQPPGEFIPTNISTTTEGAIRDAEILALRMIGKTPVEIAYTIARPVSEVRDRLLQLATRVRQGVMTLAAVRFERQDERIARVIDVLYDKIEASLLPASPASPNVFDKDLYASLYKALDHQAKLLGLYKGAAVANDWIDDADDKELAVLLVERYGGVIRPAVRERLEAASV